jgi:hypothetical protein
VSVINDILILFFNSAANFFAQILFLLSKTTTARFSAYEKDFVKFSETVAEVGERSLQKPKARH